MDVFFCRYSYSCLMILHVLLSKPIYFGLAPLTSNFGQTSLLEMFAQPHRFELHTA